MIQHQKEKLLDSWQV